MQSIHVKDNTTGLVYEWFLGYVDDVVLGQTIYGTNQSAFLGADSLFNFYSVSNGAGTAPCVFRHYQNYSTLLGNTENPLIYSPLYDFDYFATIKGGTDLFNFFPPVPEAGQTNTSIYYVCDSNGTNVSTRNPFISLRTSAYDNGTIITMAINFGFNNQTLGFGYTFNRLWLSGLHRFSQAYKISLAYINNLRASGSLTANTLPIGFAIQAGCFNDTTNIQFEYATFFAINSQLVYLWSHNSVDNYTTIIANNDYYLPTSANDYLPTGGGDPNEQGGTSGTDGGTGSFSRVSDDVTVPSLPMLSAVDAGFVTVFVPTLAQLQSLASYMWSNLFSLDTLRKLFADPMDCIIGLQILPLSIPTIGAREIAIGNIGTGVSANVASTEYIAVDCGTISVSEYWGNCLDFAPTTKLNIYLPFVGTRTLNVDEIMGTMLGVVYHFDILSGSFICFVTTDGSVKYEFAGNSALQIPITGNDFRQIIANVISIGTTIGAGLASAGTATTAAAAATAREMTAVSAACTSANNVTNSKPTIERSGSIGGTSGHLGVLTPYIIMEYPNQSLAKNYMQYDGYPSNIYSVLGDLSGFTVTERVWFTSATALDSDIDEIVALLSSGVIL